ncbi:MAG: TauD/TfdA family dioxygenase [Myxococcota bacterium]
MLLHPFDARAPGPLLVTPEGPRSVDALVAWLGREADTVRARLREAGALLFRGFTVKDAASFERVARAVDDGLQNTYLGTSPRDALTDYVFTASELPAHYPIPQHAEMSFLPTPPRTLFFCALRPNDGPGGETPLADLRAVYRDLDPAVRERWEARGLRIVRNYGGPEGAGWGDPRQLKRWDEIFGTTDRAEVERIAVAHGMTPEWRDDGRLRLTSTQPAARAHPVTGERAWYNHAHVFHGSTGPQEYRRIARRLGAWPWRGWQLAATALRWREARRAPEDAAMYVSFADGGAIPDADVDAVRDAFWKNMVFPRWEKGDVVAIDNAVVSHGRMPYRGPRLVAACWA